MAQLRNKPLVPSFGQKCPPFFAPFFSSCDRGDSKKTELLGYIRARVKPHTNKKSPPSKEGKIAYFLFLAPRPVIFSGFEKSASLFPVFFTLWGNWKVYIYRGLYELQGVISSSTNLRLSSSHSTMTTAHHNSAFANGWTSFLRSFCCYLKTLDFILPFLAMA